ncbi:hypothetical protein [Methanobrevibacter sp. DSM 116169]|uniref:hypothetical protein n=1 Tax=Methanobrevibacter sp. DSM 116169 TaxID=3242727 RepID=UPI0038FCD5B6
MELIDNLQGRGKGLTREAYFKSNPEFLKKIYINCMNSISLFNKYYFNSENKKLYVKKLKNNI